MFLKVEPAPLLNTLFFNDLENVIASIKARDIAPLLDSD
jgi:hypothetical protein